MILFLIFSIGLFIGSFLGVLIDRIPKGKTIVKGRSYCDFCKKELSWIDLVPLLSFLLLRGRCRYCNKKLPIFYPLIEFTTAILFAAVLYFFNSQGIVAIAYYLFVASCLIVIFFMDLKYGIIADKILYPLIFVTLLFFAFFQKEVFVNHILSGLGSLFFFLCISFIFYIVTKKQSVGGGDIKLSLFLGLLLGFPNIVICLYIGFLTGGITAIILILWKKKNFQKDTLPFGPFLVLGAFISIFLGDLIYQNILIFLGA